MSAVGTSPGRAGRTPGARKQATRLALLLALAVPARRPVQMLGSDELLTGAERYAAQRYTVDQPPDGETDTPPTATVTPKPARPASRGRLRRPEARQPAPEPLGALTVLDRADLDDRFGEPPPPSTSTILVVPEGYPEGRLMRFRRDLMDDDLSGFVLTRRGFRRAVEVGPPGVVREEDTVIADQRRLGGLDAG